MPFASSVPNQAPDLKILTSRQDRATIHDSWIETQTWLEDQSLAYPSSGSDLWYRDWENTPHYPPPSSHLGKRLWPLGTRVVPVPGAPNVRYKVTLPNGKVVYRRKPIEIETLSLSPSKVPTNSGLILDPRPLEFRKSSFLFSGDSSFTWTRSDGLVRYVVSGPLWCGFRLQMLSGSNPASQMNGIEFQSHPQFSGDVSSLISDCDSSALGKLYANCKGQAPNIAVAIAERSQTAGLLLQSCTRILSTLRNLRKGNIGGAVKSFFPNSPKGIANDWLVYQYGIRPLASDIQNSISYIKDPPPSRFTVRGKTKKLLERREISVSNTSHLPVSCDEHWFYTTEVTVKYQATIEVVSGFSNALSRLGITNLADVAWEVIPFSFVVDWFLPIGDFLNSSDAFTGLNTVSVHRTVFIKETVRMERRFGGSDSGHVTEGAESFAKCEQIKCVRSVLSSPPPLPAPSFKNPVSSGHAANAFALILQRFK